MSCRIIVSRWPYSQCIIQPHTDIRVTYRRKATGRKDVQHRSATVSRISDIPHYFEFKAHLFSDFSEMKIGTRLKFAVLIFTLRKSQNMFLDEQVVSLKKSEMYWREKKNYFFPPKKIPFSMWGGS